MNLVQMIKIKFIQRYINRGYVKRALKLINTMNEGYEKAMFSGVCYFEQGCLNEAQEHLKQALSYKQDYYCTRVLAEVYLYQKKWACAYEILKSYSHKSDVDELMKIIKNPNKREKYILCNSFISYALKSIRDKAYNKSIIYYKNALEYSTDKAHIYNQIGAVYLNYIKNKEMAQEYFYKAWKISPDNNIYKRNYAKAKLI